MNRFATALCLLAALTASSGGPLPAQSLSQAIEGIERHYNRLSGLQMDFEQSMEYAGRKRMAEKGTLYLMRPGKMRWDYSRPEGKIAVSDGTIFRMYSPNSNQVRQVRLDEMTDLRAPLSFLLGRMRLRRMFKNLRLGETDGQLVLNGEGRSGQDFYSRVEFSFDPGDFRISGIRIVGRDESVNVYEFSDERANPRLAADLFEFEFPEGAEVVPLTRNFNDVPFRSSER
jgi:outer membrane lipoprotein carrier protein